MSMINTITVRPRVQARAAAAARAIRENPFTLRAPADIGAAYQRFDRAERWAVEDGAYDDPPSELTGRAARSYTRANRAWVRFARVVWRGSWRPAIAPFDTVIDRMRLLPDEPWGDARRPVVNAACECARMALPIFEAAHPDDARPRHALDVAEAWARGGDDAPTRDVVLAATRDVERAVDAAYNTRGSAPYAVNAAFMAILTISADSVTVVDSAAAFTAYAHPFADRATVTSRCVDIANRACHGLYRRSA
jgi:hypothetical protein